MGQTDDRVEANELWRLVECGPASSLALTGPRQKAPEWSYKANAPFLL